MQGFPKKQRGNGQNTDENPRKRETTPDQGPQMNQKLDQGGCGGEAEVAPHHFVGFWENHRSLLPGDPEPVQSRGSKVPNSFPETGRLTKPKSPPNETRQKRPLVPFFTPQRAS